MNKETLDDIIIITNGNARCTMLEGYGGPFGATVIKDNKAISYATNSVLKDNDPTAHAEINAIRLACKYLGTYDLSGCELYTTCYPCPMCLSAIIWANIKKVYVSCSPEDAEKAGFRDKFMYEYLSGVNEEKLVDFEYVDNSKSLELFREYTELGKTIY